MSDSQNTSLNDNQSKTRRRNQPSNERIKTRLRIQRKVPQSEQEASQRRFGQIGGDILPREASMPRLGVNTTHILNPRANMPHPGVIVQPAMSVNAPNDQYEVEANQVADAVMRMPSGDLSAWTRTAPTPPKLQLQNMITRRRERVQRSEENMTPSVTPDVENRISQMDGGGQPLPDETRSFFEQRMGADFSGVRVHTDGNAAETSQAIQARAFTSGNNIAFNSGEYNPGTSEGKHLLAHELTHTVQQGAAGQTQFGPHGTTLLPSRVGLQPKMEVNAPNDQYEADRFANHVMGHAQLLQSQRLIANAQLQRQMIARQESAENAEQTTDPVNWQNVQLTGTACLISTLFPTQPTEANATTTVRSALVQLGNNHYLGKRAELLAATADFLSQIPQTDATLYSAACDLDNWIRLAAGELATAANMPDATLAMLLTTAEDRPKITYDALETDYGNAVRDAYFVRILRLKLANEDETEALRLQSQMNPMEMDSTDIEDTIEEYQNLEVTLNLVNPDPQADGPPPVNPDPQADGPPPVVNVVPNEVAIQLQTPYHINTQGRRNARGADWNALPPGHRMVQMGKGSPDQNEAAVGAFLTQQEQTNTLTATFYATYEGTPGTPAEKLEAARTSVVAEAQELLSTNQIGTDCSGTVVHVLLNANNDMEETLLDSRDVNNVDTLALNTNVRMLTSQRSGGAGDNISSRMTDLSSAMPGTMIQMGTGHIGGIISNETNTLNNLPGEIAESRAAIATELGVNNDNDREVRVVKYYHSIDETRPNEGGGVRFTNDNLPGPHTAWVVFRAPADGGTNDITDDTRWIQDVNWTENYTGLYVVTQQELIDGVHEE